MVSDKIDSVSGNIAQCMINLATKSDARMYYIYKFR